MLRDSGHVPRHRPGKTSILAISVCALLVAMGLASPAWAANEANRSSQVVVGDSTEGQLTPEDLALQQAQATGQPAEVLQDRTEDSDTWANPDGTFTVDQHATAVRVMRDGTWVPTDPTLQFAADGTVTPKAATVPVAFSGGGTGPLLTGVKDGRTLTLSWPTTLPKPTLEANVATYPDVLPDVDLQLKAEVDGFSQLLVVKTATAAQNPALATLRYTMSTAGLTVTTDSDNGSINATDPAGQTVFTSPSPLMWDSSTTDTSTSTTGTSNGRKAAVSPADTPMGGGDDFVPQPGAASAQMSTSISGNTLQITPDQSLLTDSGTQYPVYIDPSWAWGKRQDWAWAYRAYPNTSFWNANQDARVGYESDTGGLSRSFFRMDTSKFKGAHIIKSTFRIKNSWSWSCTKSTVELWQTGPISSKTTWNHQPSQISRIDTVTDAKGWDSGCAAGNLEFDATSKIAEAASKKWTSMTVGLYATKEADPVYWKRFDPKTAVFETELDHAPDQPQELGTSPNTSNSASDCANGGLIGNASISLHAFIKDPDSGNLSAKFQLFKSGSTTPVVDRTVSATNNTVKALALTDAETPTGSYSWKVQARDSDGETSAWSATCTFSVDRTRPSAPPLLASPEFPSGDDGWPGTTGQARTTGHLTLDPNGVTDVAEYGWWTDYDPAVRYITPATATASPPPFSPPGYGPHFIYAFSIDKAGNRSDTTTYVYYANGDGERDKPADLNGDGTNDIWSTDSNGTLLTYASQGNGQFSAAANGGIAVDDTQVTSRGDWGLDGYNDLVSLQPDTTTPDVKDLLLYSNNGTGVVTPTSSDPVRELSVSCPVDEPPSDDNPDGCTGDDYWHDADQVIAPGDLNGDSMPDLLVKEGSKLWAYLGSTHNYHLDEYSAPVLVGGTDWATYTVVAPGDVNGDGLPDLWLRDNTTGDIYQSLAKEGEQPGTVDPTAWGDPATLLKIDTGIPASVYPTVGSSGDITGDGIADLWARKTDNTMIGWTGKTPDTDHIAFGAGFTIDGVTGGIHIPAGTTLTAGQSDTSRSAKLTLGSDGNLTITSNAGKTLWSTGTSGNPGATLTMQTDGNLILHASDGHTALWSSHTNGPGSYALLQDRGNLVVYNVKGQTQWSSGTAIRHDDNGDGRSDMAAWYDYADGHDALHTFTTNSDGSFNAPAQSYTAPAGTWFTEHMKFATGDYNGDGRGDMAAVYGYADGSVSLFTTLSKSDGGFNTPTASWHIGPGQWNFDHMTVESGDYNGDGRDDLAVWYAYADGSNALFTFTANPQGGFNGPAQSWGAASGWIASSVKLVSGDYNGDGRDDLAALYGYADGSVAMHTFTANPTGGFNNPVKSWTSTTWGSWDRTHIVSGDYNGDGKDDVAAWYDYADGSDGVHTLVTLGDTNGTFDAPFEAWSAAPGNYTYQNMQLTSGDYNGDGRDDLGAMYFHTDGTVKMLTWLSNTDGTFNDATASWNAPAGQWNKSNAHFLGAAT